MKSSPHSTMLEKAKSLAAVIKVAQDCSRRDLADNLLYGETRVEDVSPFLPQGAFSRQHVQIPGQWIDDCRDRGVFE
jgi:hypothetical protein